MTCSHSHLAQPLSSSLDAAPKIAEMIPSQPWVVYSVSGGRDSSAAIAATTPILDALGHPREKRMIMHADLGRSEWRSTHQHVMKLAAHFGLPASVVRHRTHDMVSRWDRRGELGRDRWARGETVNLIGPWSSASLRYCTSEMKIHVMSKAKRTFDAPVITVMGIRREESRGRSLTPFEASDSGMARYGRQDCMIWNPVASWSADEVFAIHRRQAIPLHEAYGLGATRLSCNFCVLASIGDLSVASMQSQNAETYLALVEMEARYGFSFQPSRWLADVRPGILGTNLAARIANAKQAAHSRRQIEAAYPESFRKRRYGELTNGDWNAIASARREIARLHDFTNFLDDPRSNFA